MNRLALLLLVLLIGCGPDPIPDPQPADLISPSNLDTCTTASRVNDFESQVRFQWTAPLHSDSYELVIQNSITENYRVYQLYCLQSLSFCLAVHLTNGI